MEGDTTVMEYKSNLDKVMLDIKGRLTKLKDVSELQRTIGTTLLSSNLARIHNDGVAVDGAKIGSYSKKPLYVSPNKSPRKFPTKGKHGSDTFKNGKKHKTGYFNGWEGFRRTIGRETAVVNLQLSGKLRRDLALEKMGNSWVVGFRSQYGAELSEGQEKHWGKKIWGVTESDQTQIRIITEQFINKKMNAGS